MDILRAEESRRAARKARSHQRIVAAAGKLLGRAGLTISRALRGMSQSDEVRCACARIAPRMA